MSRACAGWRGDIGAYIAGALGPVEAAGVRRHLRGCAACWSEYEDLVPVRGLLDRMCPADGMPARHPPDRPPLEPALPRWGHTRRRWLTAAGAVMAAAIAVIIAISGHSAVPGFHAFNAATGVHGQADLRAMATGTQIDLTLTGLPAGQLCTLVTVSRAGTAVAGTWTAEYDGTARITGNSAISIRQLTTLRIEAPPRRLLLSIPL
jgi:hypothetical protein